MKLPSFAEAERVARTAVNAGRPVPEMAQEILGLRFWWRMPVCLRTTASGKARRGMARRYIAAIRARLPESASAAVIQGATR